MKKLWLALILALGLLAAPAQAADAISGVAACGTAGSIVIPLAGPAYTTLNLDITSTNGNGTIGFFVTGPRSLVWTPVNVTPIPLSPPQTTVVGTGAAFTFQGVVQVVGYSSFCISATATWASGTATVVAVPTVAQWEPYFMDIPTGNMVSQYASSTAPGAGAAVVTVTAPGAGTYDITVIASYGASAATPADFNNLQLQVGAGAVGRILIPGTANGLPVTQTWRRIAVPAATNVSVNAVGAATAGAVYTATIQYIPVN